MTDNNRIRKGSLQFYPRVRAKKIVPRANWKKLSSKTKTSLLGFVGYKAGMVSVWAKDNTEDSMSKGKKVSIPASVVECPGMKIFSVRFYKRGKVAGESIVSNEKILKRRVKVPKKGLEIKVPADYDDIRVIVYSLVGKTGIGKKKPDMIEIAIGGKKEDKLNYVQGLIGKEIKVSDVFTNELVDLTGVTRGFGTSEPVKRFGIGLKNHKTEKGVRRPGSLAPWHPARVTFRAPMAGQTGYQTRISYNNLIMNIGNADDELIKSKKVFEHYGVIKNEYLVIKGSVSGPKKRGVLMTLSSRPSKNTIKKKYEVLELR